MSRATLEMVAERAGVSRQTVSNVLNAPHLVAATTASRVQAAIDALDYRPHRAARQLRTRRSQVLGLRIPPAGDGINGAVLDRFLHALTERAQAQGYRVLLFTAAHDEGEIAQYGDLLDTADLDGFVLTSTHHGDPRVAWLTEHAVPFVTFGRPWDDHGLHPWVDVDGAAGVRLATEHLQAAGHHRIGFLGWPEGSDVGADRRSGWVQAMRSAGWSDDGLATLEVAGEDSVADGAAATRTLLATAAPTAVVAVSDSLALGALTATRDTPLAVVGFDDTPVAAALGLSSVAQPLVAAADHAVRLLLSRLVVPSGHEAGAAAHALLTPRLVVRTSSRPVPHHRPTPAPTGVTPTEGVPR